MERFGKLNIAIGIDSRYCAECGAPELEDGCSNASCWRARPNSRFPISLAIQQLAIEKTFPSRTARKGLMHKYIHSLCLSILSPTGSRA
jgi:predicted amidophosphoribosyltransferase